MTEKEQLILIKILPQLESLANHLWDNDNLNPMVGRKVDRITDELRNILNKEND
jgi:hypothetical protein